MKMFSTFAYMSVCCESGHSLDVGGENLIEQTNKTLTL